MRRLQYLLALNILLGFTNLLHAEQDHAVRINVSQPDIDSAQIPQALRDFIFQAIKQGLSIDQIVEQAVEQGYPKDQVVIVCSDIMAQEVDEASSTQNTLMWCMLGTIIVTAVGVGLLYIFLQSPQKNRLTMVPSSGLRPNQPLAGYDLSIQERERVNEIITQGIAEGRIFYDISEDVRRTFPDTRFYMERLFNNGGKISVTTRSWNEAGPGRQFTD